MITYTSERPINAAQFIQVLNDSTLGERRPVHDPDRMQRMLDHADVIVTAWDGALLVGVARTITDWSYCAYLSDLAVHRTYQRQGIGKALIQHTQDVIGTAAMLLLLAAPAAADYYAHIGFEKVENGWMLHRKV